MSLRELAQTAKQLKTDLADAQAKRWDAMTSAESDVHDAEIKRLTNELYDATRDLGEALEAETGIPYHKFPDLLVDNGYVISKTVPLPRRMQEAFND